MSNLEGADLRGADLKDADLRGSDLRYSYLPNNIMEAANIQDCIFGYNKNEEALKGTTVLKDLSSWKTNKKIQYTSGPKPEVFENMMLSIIASYDSYDRDFIISIVEIQISEIEELLRK